MFNYDNRGNITSKVRYAYTTLDTLGTALQTISCTYQATGWKDILTGVGGVTYTNDAIGNRTSDGTWSYTWEHGRQLAGMTKSGTSIAYDYGADGYRISKAVTEGGTTTTYNYFYSGGKLLHVSWNDSDRVHIFYNAGGSPISILYNGTRYYYVKNVQGDIVGLTTTSGLLRVAYTYDAWGNPLTTTGSMASTLGQVNPLRYRGYVYDSETGLYYLGSRYYDPGVGRFINADDVSLLGINNTVTAFNLFAYCLNNPVGNLDIDGDFAITTLILIGSIIIGGGAAVYHGYNMRQAGASWEDTILESLTFGLGVGCTVYTWGMSAYALYYDYCMYRGYVPRTHIGSPEGELQKAAETANSSVDGNGHVAGTKKHKVFSDSVKSYKNERIVTEASYKNVDYVSCGTKRSIRFDVVQYNKYGKVIKAWDFKTGSAYLSQSRISTMIRRSGLDIPIHMIK